VQPERGRARVGGAAAILLGATAWGSTGTAAAICGCAILVTGGRAAGVSLAGVCLALVAGLCYAIYAVTAARLISGGTGERAVMGALFGGAAVLLTPVLVATSPGWLLSARGWPSRRTWAW
jgi:drug/metabolite transporter, DME family